MLSHLMTHREQQVYEAGQKGLGKTTNAAAKILDELIRTGGPGAGEAGPRGLPRHDRQKPGWRAQERPCDTSGLCKGTS